MAGTAQQRKGFEFLTNRRSRPFSVSDFAKATGYKESTAGTNLSEHWARVVETVGGKWRARPRFARLTYEEFLAAISQGKRLPTEDRLYLLVDASAVVPYYVPQATRSEKLRDRIKVLFDAVRKDQLPAQLYIPNFCIAEVFSVFMKHGFSNWNSHVKATLSKAQYRAAVDRFQDDIHNGKLLLQYELNRYHVLGINLVAPVDHHYQMMRPKRRAKKNRRNPTPAGTFDQLILSMGVQLARVHGAPNTIVVTADKRLSALAQKCRSGIAGSTRTKLGLDRTPELVGLEFKPETFPNAVDLQRASRSSLESLLGHGFPR